jgi:hypothetical protein
VEHAADGIHFTKVFTKPVNAAAVNETVYNWLHEQPAAGNNYYRIKSVDISGSFQYSSIMQVDVSNSKAGIQVLANPVQGGTVHLQFTELPKGKYEVRLTNLAGQVLYKQQISHTGGTAVYHCILKTRIPTAQYQLEITSTGGSHTQKIFVQQDN